AWPRRGAWSPGGPGAPSDTARLLTLLSQLQDTARIDTLLGGLAAGAYSKGDNTAIVRAAGLLPPERGAALIEHLIARHAATHLSACGDLLARSVAARVTGPAADLSRAATALVEAMPGDLARMPQRAPWSRSLPVESGFFVDLLTALEQISTALADRAVDHILAWPQTYEPDAVLVPAVLGLTGSVAHQAATAVQRLRTAAL